MALGLSNTTKIENTNGDVINPSTEEKQDTGNTSLSSIDTKVSTEAKQDTAITALNTLSTEAKLEAVRVILASLDGKDFATQTTLNALLTELQLKADLSETQPVSVSSLPLPTGASTEAKQDTGNTSISSIDGKVSTESKQDTGNTSLSSLDTKTGEVQATPTANTILARLKDIGNRPLTAFGDLRVATLSPIFQGTFEYTVDNTDLTTNSIVAGGTVIQAEAMAVLTTSTTTGSSAKLLSKQHARYRSGLGGMARFTALFTVPVATTEQLIGLADEAGSSESFRNGYMIGYIGTVFGFHRFQNDVLFSVPLADWDDPLDGSGHSGMTIEQTNLNVFFIQFEFLGAGSINIFVENSNNGDKFIAHTVLYANLNITPSVFNPNFFYTVWVDNKATSSNLILKSSSYAYFIEGKTEFMELHRPEFSTGMRTKTNVITEVAIFTIRNRETYASKKNFIDVLIQYMSASIEASSPNNLGSVRLVKNATIGGTPSYSNINTTNSVVEIDTSGTTVSGGTELFPAPLAGKNDKVAENIADLKFILSPGETLTLAGLSANIATIEGSTLWRELF